MITVQTAIDITFNMLFDENEEDGNDVAIPAGTLGTVLAVGGEGVTVDFEGTDYNWIVETGWLEASRYL